MKNRLLLLVACIFIAQLIVAQTVPVTFHLDAHNHQYQTAQLWHMPNLYDLTDDDGDQVFEVTMDLSPGEYYYHLLRDNGWGWDPENPDYPNGIPSDGSIMHVSDPMISYLLPKNGDFLRENRIRAIFAFTPQSPPILASIAVTINGNTMDDAQQYYDAETKSLLIENPQFLNSGANTVVVNYETAQGSISRTSLFKYRPIELMMDSNVIRMDTILAWGRVFSLPLPAMVYLQNQGTDYQASVNEAGYFGVPVKVFTGANTIKVAYSEDQLSDPVDEMVINAEIRHKWWVELTANIAGNSASINALQHIEAGTQLSLQWFEDEENPETIGLSGTGNQVSFSTPQTDGVYQFGVVSTDNAGETYTARKMLVVKDGVANFLGIHQRAPWMEKMVVYEVEQNVLDQFTFQGLKVILPHIKKAGINTFRITPFVSGGFIAYDHFDIFKPYGTMEDLQDLISTAHQYGIRVLFDVPLSHICPFHPFLYPSFLLKDKAEPYSNFVLWQGNPGESDIVHSPDNGRQCVYTNLDNAYVQNYFYRLMEYWVEVAQVDGFRIDCGQESFLRSPEFMTAMLTRLRNINPNIFILQEGDNRDHPDVNYYDFGDSAYDWYLNTRWNGETLGFPAVFAGNYSPDQLHELLTTGTPDSGLILRYANCGYFDYLHNIYGWEQERTAFAIVATSYGLLNVFQGEMVGGERANGSFDFSDPLQNMPFYSRLLKTRNRFLGNYPDIHRVSLANGDKVYAYTAIHDTAIILTVANLTASPLSTSINLSDPAFNGTGITHVFDVIDMEFQDLNGIESFDVDLEAWKTKVFVANATGETLFPPISNIEIISLNGAYEINEDDGSLQFITTVLPVNSMGEIEWELQGNTDFATLENGILCARGCGDGEVIVMARSIENPDISTQVTIPITNQLFGQVENGSFDEDLYGWFLWTPECNTTLVNSNNQALITFEDNNGELCWSQFLTTTNHVIENGRSYVVSFDASASNNRSVYCMAREDGNNYAAFCGEEEFFLTEEMQHFSFRFTMTLPTSTIGQLQFNMGGDNDWFRIDNVSLCTEPETTTSLITFNVDMQNEMVSGDGVHMNGSWSNWGDGPEMTPVGSIYSTTLELNIGDAVEYKFINGALFDWDQYELISGSCASVPDGNRTIIVPPQPTNVDLVCFGSCEPCNVGISNSLLNDISAYPNPANRECRLVGLPAKDLDITIYALDGKQLSHVKSNEKTAMVIDISNYPSGTYRIIVMGEKERKCIGLIKE